MLKKLASRLTYANVMATIAVFLALGGGLAWALSNNSVKSRHIKNGQVRSADTANPKPHDLRNALSADCSEVPGTMCGTSPNDYWHNQPPAPSPGADYSVDSEGFVHLQGHVLAVGSLAGSTLMFTLPIRLKPSELGPEGGSLTFPALCFSCTPKYIWVFVANYGSGPIVSVAIAYSAGLDDGDIVSLDGISWRTG